MLIQDHKFTDLEFVRATGQSGKALTPTKIVLHDTAGALTPGNVVRYFAGSGCRVSAHIVVERDGTAVQMVPFNIQAWHADPSHWDGKAGCNWRAIGIEIVNPGMMERRGSDACLIYRTKNAKTGRVEEKVVGRYPLGECVEVDTPEHGKGWCLPYTDAQLDTVKAICRALTQHYGGIDEILTHWMIAPKRKVDTTPLMPLEEVRAAAFGPEPEPEPIEAPVPPGHVAAGTAEVPSTGAFSNRSFTLINQLSEQGSRLATHTRNLKNWCHKLIFGTPAAAATAYGLADTNKGVGHALASDPCLLWGIGGFLLGLVVAGAVGYLYVKLRLEPSIVSAARAGRYRPAGA